MVQWREGGADSHSLNSVGRCSPWDERGHTRWSWREYVSQSNPWKASAIARTRTEKCQGSDCIQGRGLDQEKVAWLCSPLCFLQR